VDNIFGIEANYYRRELGESNSRQNKDELRAANVLAENAPDGHFTAHKVVTLKVSLNSSDKIPVSAALRALRGSSLNSTN